MVLFQADRTIRGHGLVRLCPSRPTHRLTFIAQWAFQIWHLQRLRSSFAPLVESVLGNRADATLVGVAERLRQT